MNKGILRKTGVGALAALVALVTFGFIPFAAPAAAQEENVACARLSGADRYETAAEIALNTFPGGSDIALIARGDGTPLNHLGVPVDALSGSYGAGVAEAPILLTPGAGPLPDATLDAMEALGVTAVFILGEVAAVSDDVEDELVALFGADNVDRVGGADRFETAALIAGVGPVFVNAAGESSVFLANGFSAVDALSAGGPSYAENIPILLSQAEELNEHAAEFIEENDIERVYILGGTVAISANTASQVSGLNGGTEITRLSGGNRAATAVDIAIDFLIDELGWSTEHFVLANGAENHLVDAVAGGPHAGVEESMILLALGSDTLGDDTESFLEDLNDGELENGETVQEPTSAHILGGRAAINDETAADACTLAGVPTDDGEVTVTANQTTVEQGEDIVLTVTGENIESVTVTGCGINETFTPAQDEDAAAGGNQFTVTVPADQAAGDCQLTVTTTFTDDTTEVDTVDITVTERPGNATVTSRPELVNAQIVGTNTAEEVAANPNLNEGTTVRFCFDEPITGGNPTPGLFRVYSADGAFEAGEAGTAVLDANETCVVVNFANVNTDAEAANLTVAAVNEGAVIDDQGDENPIGDAPLGTNRQTTVGQAGITEAPDLESVSGFTPQTAAGGGDVTLTNVTFTFDEAAFTVNPAGFHLVTVDGDQIDCVAVAGQAGGQPTATQQADTTIVAECEEDVLGRDITAADIARGFVDEVTVSDARADQDDPATVGIVDCDTVPANATADCTGNVNPLQATQTPDANSTDPDLVSAVFTAGATAADDDTVTYTFDEPIQVTDPLAFQVYDINGEETNSTAAVRSGTNNRVVIATFDNGTVDDAVGASVEDSAVTAATGTARTNEEDEVGVTNQQTSTITAGRTAGPDLIDVDVVETATGPVVVYTFDENIDEADAALDPTDFDAYLADGTHLQCATATSNVSDGATGTAATTDDNTVRCTDFDVVGFGIATPGQVRAVVLGTVEEFAVSDGTNFNPKGAEVASEEPAA